MVYQFHHHFAVLRTSLRLPRLKNNEVRIAQHMISCTEPRKSLGTWLREISSCSSLTYLPGPAWVLLSKICQDFFLSSVCHLGTPILLFLPHNEDGKANKGNEGATNAYHGKHPIVDLTII